MPVEAPAPPVTLSNDEILRYSRHLIMPEVGMEGQLKLKQAKVLLVGTGGLGAPLGMYLAAAGIGRIAIGEDELAARQAGKARRQPRVGRDPVERDRMHILKEVVRVDRMLLHQPGKRRPVRVEMRFLDALGLVRVAAEQPGDIGAHALVDQREQAGRRRIQAIVEVEDPVADMGEARVHGLGRRLAQSLPASN